MKGYAERRRSAWRSAGHQVAATTGHVEVSGWQQLAALAEKGGRIPVQHGGERLVN